MEITNTAPAVDGGVIQIMSTVAGGVIQTKPVLIYNSVVHFLKHLSLDILSI